jgi:hypothetical protein
VQEEIFGPVLTVQTFRTPDEALSMAGLFGLQDAAEALSAGEWIEITGFDGLMNMLEGFAGESSQPDEQQVEALRQAFADRTERLIDEDVQVSYVGSDDVGERVRVVVDGPALQRYINDIGQVLQSNDLLEGVDAAEFDDLVDEIPDDVEVTFDAWIDGDELRQIAATISFFLQSCSTLVGGIFLLGGLVGLYVRQSEAAKKLGVVGFVLAFLGTALVVGDFYANTFLEHGGNVRALSAYLGHHDPGFTLRVYGHLMSSSADRARSIIEGSWEASRSSRESVTTEL